MEANEVWGVFGASQDKGYPNQITSHQLSLANDMWSWKMK